MHIMQELNGVKSISVFDLITDDLFAKIYIIVSIIVSLAFTLGYRSRINGIILLLMYWNLMQAASTFVAGYDFYGFNLLFLSLFLPLDNHFSVLPSKHFRRVPLSFSVLIVIQICLIYFATGMAKYGDSWLNGFAVKIMASDKWLTYPMAVLFSQSPLIYKSLTYLTLFFECFFPLFVLIPYRNHVFRCLAVLFLVGFHGSILCIYNVANFPIIGFSAAALLLPSKFWDIFSRGKNSGILMSGVEKVCHFRRFPSRWISYIFVFVLTYMICLNNLKFLFIYSPLNKITVAADMVAALNKVSLISPVRNSIFFQCWKMFAPDPMGEIGWISIEERRADGYMYDLFSGSIVSATENKINFQPGGMELHLLAYVRGMRYGNKSFTRVFMKYWYLHQLQIRGVSPVDYKNYYLAEYRCYFSPHDEFSDTEKIVRSYFSEEVIMKADDY